jgi:hypothetical protein
MPVTDDHFWDYLFTRRIAVFDGSQTAQEPVVLTDETGQFVLTDETGKIILTPSVIVPLTDESGTKTLTQDDATTVPLVTVVIGQLVRWI